LATSPPETHKYRFVCTPVGLSNFVLSTNDFADLVCTAASAVSAFRFFSATRLIRVEVWVPSTSTNFGVATTLNWLSGSTTDPFECSAPFGITDMPMGSNDIGHIISKPPPNSVYSRWISGTVGLANAVQMLALNNLPQNSVVEFTVQGTRVSGTTGAPFTPVGGAVVGATAGLTYVRTLPSSIGVGNGLAPVNNITI